MRLSIPGAAKEQWRGGPRVLRHPGRPGLWPRRVMVHLATLVIFSLAASFFGRACVAQSEELKTRAARIAELSVVDEQLAVPRMEGLETALMEGRYEQVINWCERAIHDRAFGEEWYLAKGEAELAIGKCEAAWATLDDGIRRYPWSVRIRILGVDAGRMTGRDEEVEKYILEVRESATRAPWRYSDADNLVALGEMAVDLGADARTVLESFYDRALQLRAKHRRAMLASARLALSKQDYKLAADTIESHLKNVPEDTEATFLLSQTLRPSNPVRAAILLSTAIRQNPRLLPALVDEIEVLIDGEQYDEAAERLDELEAIHAELPELWALRAVLRELDNDRAGAAELRDRALVNWHDNPAVDHLIGRKLSQKYRFREGAEYQRKALEFSAEYGPSRRQLAEDLLRLGQEEEGWKLAEATHSADPYDVQLFNLTQLKTQIETYTTLRRGPFVVRMEPREARLYGNAVLDLLERAQMTLGAKYGYEPPGDVLVEIFPEPDDFAVRTFGLPGASGYLGVCFGRVITANSPAALPDTPSNWESVLWHEYCHVVTLELTKHRLPRWLSEGISVYEERLADPTWGARMSPRFRQLILSGQLTPIDELSSAFLRPDGAGGLAFAYYQSSLVVDFLVERYGFETLRGVLDDLSNGLLLNDSLERRTTPFEQLNAEFQDYARERARRYGELVDWTEHDLSDQREDDDPDRLQRWLDEHPNNLQGLVLRAEQLTSLQRYEEAKVPLRKLIELFPEYTAGGESYDLLATVHRLLKEPDDELEVLLEFARRADAVTPVYLRIIELAVASENWEAVREAARRQLAVNPLLPAPHRALALAAEKLGDDADARRALESLLELSPDSVADLHYRLARILQRQGDAGAKRAVLQALEAAPRFREAQTLLLELTETKSETSTAEEVKP